MAQQNAIGKLVDLYNGPEGSESKVHFNYNSVGLVRDQTWTLSLFGADSSGGSASFTYDSQGRVERLAYPQNLPGSYNAFTAQYTYDPYTGTVLAIADATTPSVPMWKATARNALGEVTTEKMISQGGVTLFKNNDYFLTTGALRETSLPGSGATATVNYTYKANGLPATMGWTGTNVGANWTATFTYDNLSRLTNWQPNTNESVAYGYDSDGNLTTRSWRGETATYSNFSGTTHGRRITIAQGSSVVRTEDYQTDLWSRVFDTPSATLNYNALDEVISVVEKSNSGQTDKIVRDGLGSRLATTYGTDPSGPYLLTLLGDLYQFKSGSVGQEERYRLRGDGSRVVGDVVRTSATGPKSSTFYLTDQTGTVLAEAGDTGELQVRTRRDPFGNPIANAATPNLPSNVGSDGTSRLGFGDHERDVDWGVIDMNARFYAPALGRFLSPDSVIGAALDRRAYNPYAYAWNNPVAMADPGGHNPLLKIVHYFLGGGAGPGDPPDPDPLPHSIANGGSGGPRFLPELEVSPTNCAGCSPNLPPTYYGPKYTPAPTVSPTNVAAGASTSPAGAVSPNLGLHSQGTTESSTPHATPPNPDDLLSILGAAYDAGGWLARNLAESIAERFVGVKIPIGDFGATYTAWDQLKLGARSFHPSESIYRFVAGGQKALERGAKALNHIGGALQALDIMANVSAAKAAADAGDERGGRRAVIKSILTFGAVGTGVLLPPAGIAAGLSVDSQADDLETQFEIWDYKEDHPNARPMLIYDDFRSVFPR